MNNELYFILICNCGKSLGGYFSPEDQIDRVHCDCGLIWEMKRPNKQEEQIEN